MSGQAGQIPKANRDRLLLNGVGSIGTNFAFNFLTPRNGIGALRNVFNGIGDGGHIRIFSGSNLSGNFIGEADFGSPIAGQFGGIISTELISSVEITCEFDSDLRCGIYDLQFGTAAVPVPAALLPCAFAFCILFNSSPESARSATKLLSRIKLTDLMFAA